MFIAGTVILSTIQVEDFKTDVGTELAAKNPALVEESEHKILPFLKAKPREAKGDAGVKAYVASLAEGQGDVNQALVDFKDGKITSYQGQSHGELQKADLSSYFYS